MSETPDDAAIVPLSILERAEAYSEWLEGLPLGKRVAHLLMQGVSWRSTQKDYEALERLVTRENALHAWEKLRAMTVMRDGWSFDSVVLWMGREAGRVFLPPSRKRTAAEIERAGRSAADLAIKLAELIEGHSTLQFSGWEIAPPVSNESPWPFHEISHEGLTYRLRAFAALAVKSASYPPVLPRPNQDLADAHVLSVEFCYLFEYAYGTPCIEIATALVSEAFDTLLDANTVKKWWQRRAVDDGEGDTSEELP